MPLASIIALLHGSIGLDAASVGHGSIERAVKQRMAAAGLKSQDAYLKRVQTSEAEFQELVEAVVVPETWFFRHEESFAALQELITRRFPLTKKLRLLSVPCATGEEPFSIAMSLLDAGLTQEQFQIDGLDISARSVAIARAGIFGRNSFRNRDLAWRERYFTATPAGFQLHESIQSCTRLRQENILGDAFLLGEESYDFIFCRNLLIYFDDSTQARVVTRLRSLLAPDGFLFVGPAEPSLFVRHHFVSARLPLAFAFHPPGWGGAAIQPATRPMPAPRKAAPKTTPALIRPKEPVPVPPAVASRMITPDLDLASRLADEGRLNEAAEICESFLREKGASARAFYLLGLVRDVSGQPGEATRYYRKTLYLDPAHYEALMHLALLNEKSGDRAAANVLKTRARRVRERAETRK